jgi:hypothetical protein
VTSASPEGRCARAPRGWSCLRVAHHQGPCKVLSDSDMQPATVIARRLREVGKSQAWLADQTGLSAKHINQMLTGTVGISWPMLQRLAEALGGTVSVKFEEVS